MPSASSELMGCDDGISGSDGSGNWEDGERGGENVVSGLLDGDDGEFHGPRVNNQFDLLVSFKMSVFAFESFVLCAKRVTFLFELYGAIPGEAG